MRRFSFGDLKLHVQERIERINSNRDAYRIEEQYDTERQKGDLSVFCDVVPLVRFHYLVSNIRREDDKLYLRASTTIHRRRYPSWYETVIHRSPDLDVHINEFRDCRVKNEAMTFDEVMGKYLPLSRDEDVDKINRACKLHKLDIAPIVFDTAKGEYRITSSEIRNLLKDNILANGDKTHILLYKYVSYNTLLNMLGKRTFRMNSIVSMNDMSETLWSYLLSHGVAQADNDRYSEAVVTNQNILIASFTDKCDDATMWRLYGNNGCGACLGFQIPMSAVHKVVYVNPKDNLFEKLASVSRKLDKEGISFRYEELESNNNKYFIKGSSYSVEGEYRVLYDASGEDLKIADYEGLLSPYKDFSLYPNKVNLLPFEMVSATLGRNIPNFSTNEPVLIDWFHRLFPRVTVYESKVFSIR